MKTVGDNRCRRLELLAELSGVMTLHDAMKPSEMLPCALARRQRTKGLRNDHMTETKRSARDLVLAFYEAAFCERDAEKAREFLGDIYIQHNPAVPDGPEGVLSLVRFRRDRFPNSHSEVKRVIAEGDLVALHIHSVLVPGTPGRNIVDIFRVDGDRIVEHWDAVQEIPERVFPPLNDNGVF
jgi:predicted SnoaL-like aldol condensation-catalyzing enzyme